MKVAVLVTCVALSAAVLGALAVAMLPASIPPGYWVHVSDEGHQLCENEGGCKILTCKKLAALGNPCESSEAPASTANRT